MLDINIKWTKTIHDAIIPPHPPLVKGGRGDLECVRSYVSVYCDRGPNRCWQNESDKAFG